MNEEAPISEAEDADPKDQANFIFNEVNSMIASALRSVRIVTGDTNLDLRSNYPSTTMSSRRD